MSNSTGDSLLSKIDIFGLLGNKTNKNASKPTNNASTMNSPLAATTNNSKENTNKNRNGAAAVQPAYTGPPAIYRETAEGSPAFAAKAGPPAIYRETAEGSPAFAAKGGMAPVGFSYGPRMQQPSREVMEWATPAGDPTPTGPQMRNVAHGGKRRTSKRRTHRVKHRKSHKKHTRKHRTMKRKTHRKHGKKRN